MRKPASLRTLFILQDLASPGERVAANAQHVEVARDDGQLLLLGVRLGVQVFQLFHLPT